MFATKLDAATETSARMLRVPSVDPVYQLRRPGLAVAPDALDYEPSSQLGIARPNISAVSRETEIGETTSVIGSDLVVTGKLHTNGIIRIDGKLDGDIQAAKVLVAPGGVVTGQIEAEIVEVFGAVAGKIRASTILLRQGAHFEGDAEHSDLMIETGAIFDGSAIRVQRATLSK